MRKVLLWSIAIVITLLSAYYQRISGPTKPKYVKFSYYDTTVNLKFIRTNGQTDADIKLNIPENLTAKIFYRIYPTKEQYKTIEFTKKKNNFTAKLPVQKPAGKLQYYVEIYDMSKPVFSNADETIIIRFKGNVPAVILIIHILFMFAAMLLSNITGIFAIAKNPKQVKFALYTLILLVIGGAIFGPIVQKYAFGQFWTGIPFGWDLTDNKTLIALIFWVVAYFTNRKKERRWTTIVAAAVTLIIFAIPHSLFGSQLDPNTGKVIQGLILNPFLF